ncbi:YihY/virulence factor BrkB family protein [Tropicimonas sp. TH_r6]|uniref:YihY/virulence factor BrkB family protein n=1 Tax=Tropicimonas sp. TH_r6 TaxID=3082085 RepID=UPI002953E5BC|nr:YihY/virulence factor BrkB family protein [Tropicimonas sp. TH_r6]MDV7143855.1 YihY/virulence factor BrkB family protein [Tropicimonas sp. TH_r6]
MLPGSIVFKSLIGAWHRFDTDHGWSKASHVAMSMMMALFPFCIFALSLAGQFSTNLDVNSLIDFVYGSWPEEIAEPITREVRAVLAQSGAGPTTFGALLAVYFASNGVDAIRGVVTDAYRDQDPRPVWRQRLLCLGFVLAGAAMIAVVGAVTIGLPLYFDSLEGASAHWIAEMLLSEPAHLLTTMLLLLFALYACHAWLPGVGHSAKQVLPGVILTMVLWIAAGEAFSYYLQNYSSYSVTYAGLAGVMAALVFLYVMAAIFVFCAEFNGQLHASASVRPGTSG